MRSYARLTVIPFVVFLVCTAQIDVLGKDNVPVHPIVGKQFVPTDVDFDNPVYECSFDNPADLRDWEFEGGFTMQVPWYDVCGHKVWGATAIMLSELEQRVSYVIAG